MPISNVWVTLVDLVPLIGGFLTLGSHGKGLRTLFYYCALAIPFDLLNLSLKLQGFNNLWVLHVFTLTEYVILSWLLSYWAHDTARQAIRLSILAFAGLWLVSKILIEPFSSYDNYTSTGESVLMIAMSTYLLLQLGATSDNLTMDSRFWGLIGIMTYFAGNLTIFALRNYIYYWYFHNVILTIANFLYLKAFLCSRSPRSSGLY